MLGGRANGPLIVNKKILQHFSQKKRSFINEKVFPIANKFGIIYFSLFF